jgi:hypothetical protein
VSGRAKRPFRELVRQQWSFSPPGSTMVPQCHLVNIFYHCSPRPSSDDSLGKSHERAEPRSIGGDRRLAWARPCSRDRPYEGSVSPACLTTVAANRRFAKLYLSPIRAVPARGLVDARVGGSTVQSVLRCHKLCEIWHTGAYFDRLSRNCKQRRTRWWSGVNSNSRATLLAVSKPSKHVSGFPVVGPMRPPHRHWRSSFGSSFARWSNRYS